MKGQCGDKKDGEGKEADLLLGGSRVLRDHRARPRSRRCNRGSCSRISSTRGRPTTNIGPSRHPGRPVHTGHSGNKVSAFQRDLDAGGTTEPQRSTRCDYGAQQGALDQPRRALTLPSDPALIPRARRDTRAAQRRAVSTSWASLHCTKTVVILCEYAVALKRVQKYTRSRGVGTGAPAMVAHALILSSMSAFRPSPRRSGCCWA